MPSRTYSKLKKADLIEDSDALPSNTERRFNRNMILSILTPYIYSSRKEVYDLYELDDFLRIHLSKMGMHPIISSLGKVTRPYIYALEALDIAERISQEQVMIKPGFYEMTSTDYTQLSSTEIPPFEMYDEEISSIHTEEYKIKSELKNTIEKKIKQCDNKRRRFKDLNKQLVATKVLIHSNIEKRLASQHSSSLICHFPVEFWKFENEPKIHKPSRRKIKISFKGECSKLSLSHIVKRTDSGDLKHLLKKGVEDEILNIPPGELLQSIPNRHILQYVTKEELLN
ncbi:unnamed protein product [Moneuplotes crassus]|uniref:Uncharacterized protein n=1 Tax=Euplotes crassus TaxID=5936 RepID=A0AAD1XR15_EUPCR|nr:unnamed protein product [Moneuplotes crassus]